MREAKHAGFEIVVVYVALETVELHVERVRVRKSRGGHDVPGEDIRRRYIRSLANAPKALQIADRGLVLDNTQGEVVELLKIQNGQVLWRRPGPMPSWAAEIERALLDPHLR